MRTTQLGGLCAVCGIERDDGLYYTNRYFVWDWSVLGIDAPPVEPDMSQPVRCDACETRHTVTTTYQANPTLARQIYCAETPAAALRILGY
jgi:hypothetical protein